MHIIIIGASSGLGFETARLLIEAGHTLGLAARRQQPLKTLQSLAPERVFITELDALRPDADQRLEDLIEQMGGMDLYLHSSGVGYTNIDLIAEQELHIVELNATAFTRLVGCAFRYFARTGREGHIANISSIAGTMGLGASPAYSATKRFQTIYLQSLAQLCTIRRLKIHFTDIRPGFVRTPFIEGYHYPMEMKVEHAARLIVRALHRRSRVAIIDWRYRLLVALWRLVPDRLWERLPIQGGT